VDIREIQAYAYFFFTIFLVVVLYGYILHLYRSEKKGIKDYEKYGKLALDDELESPLLEGHSKADEKKVDKKENVDELVR
jgi:cytochrome c oxidase cbb3-type subunit 4